MLEQTSSLAVVRDFLKSRNTRFSAGSWVEMYEKRVVPAIESFQITNVDLIELLRIAEENGKQHVFLYQCSDEIASWIMDRARVTQKLKDLKLEQLTTTPLILESSDAPCLVDVRWNTADVDLSLIVKEVYTRRSEKFVRNEVTDGWLHKIYEYQKHRVVNLAKLHRNGLLEIRLASQLTSSNYEYELARFIYHIKDLVPVDKFSDIPLSTARKRIWAERRQLATLIRYSDATIRDDFGNVLKAATGSVESDLNNQKAISDSLDSVLTSDTSAYCSGQNIWFKKSKHLQTDTHVLLNGTHHEFALPANCGMAEYEHVFDQIRQFNKPLS
ncbi:MAG: hypothetical protein EoVTN8_423 [Fluviibacter phosphoraccumulans EoVTN8]